MLITFKLEDKEQGTYKVKFTINVINGGVQLH